MRDVTEHIDDYALDQGRQKAVARQSLEMSTLETEGPTLQWLQARLNAREPSQTSQALFAAVKETSHLFRASPRLDGHPPLSNSTTQALRARTAGRSAGVGNRRALTGSVTTATVLPVMSKNSTE